MTDAIKDAIAAASAAAAASQTANNTTQVPAVTGQTSTEVGMPAMAGAALSMETIGSGGMSVDKWLKVKEMGLMIGEDKTLFDEIKGMLDMTDGVGFMVKYSIKAGNPAKYESSYDGQVTTSGRPWAQVCKEFFAMDGKATPYRAVDLPFTVLETLKNKKGEVLIEENQRLGYSTSTTNWGLWEAFYREVSRAGLLGQKVEVVIGFQARAKNNNNWGVVSIKLVGAYVEGEGE